MTESTVPDEQGSRDNERHGDGESATQVGLFRGSPNSGYAIFNMFRIRNLTFSHGQPVANRSQFESSILPESVTRAEWIRTRRTSTKSSRLSPILSELIHLNIYT